MKKRNVTFFIIAIILVGMTSLCHAYVAYYSLFVVDGEDWSNIYQLKILPNGQILDTYIQYSNGGNYNQFVNGSLAVSPDNQFLFATGDAIYRYQIQPDGSLVSIGSTTPAESIAITPNEQLAIGDNIIYSLTSTGDLVNGTPGPEIGLATVDPLGRGVLAGITSGFSAYTINYNTRTLNETTTFPRGDGELYGFDFTPDGKLGFMYGFNLSPNNTGDLWVLKIDSTFSVTTSQVLSVSQGVISDLAVSNDSRYLWASAGYIELFAIDTLGNVTDTGKEYYVSNDTGEASAGFQKNTPDGRLAIVDYFDWNSDGVGFATAFINGDGSLTWTGYTFAFDSAHPTGGTVVDYAIVPVYATGIPEELWKDSLPEITIHDSQEIVRNP